MLPGGLIRQALGNRLGLPRSLFAFRLQNLIFVFVLTVSLYMLVFDTFGPSVALLSTVSFFVLPRAFYDAHIAALDYPMAALWAATACAFWKGLRSPRWMLLASFCLGLALLTKIHGAFLHVTLVAWFVVWYRAELWHLVRKPGAASLKKQRRVVWALLALLLIPPVVFVLGWPWLWPQPITRIVGYFQGLLQHFTVPVYYFGQRYAYAPWHYPFVMTAITLPLIVLIPLLYGLFRILTPPDRAAKLFLLVNAAVPILALAFLTRCKYDGVRLFLPAFPFICAIAAIAVRDLYRLARRARLGRAFLICFLLLFGISVYASVVRYHPHQACYYNEIVGGIRGATEKGFETVYWGGPYKDILGWLKAHPHAKVRVPIGGTILRFYQRIKLLDTPVKYASRGESDFLILLCRQGSFDEELWRYYREGKAIFSVTLLGTPLLSIYETDKRFTPARAGEAPRGP
jgi:4-amino-4-deoxy-L-arabinose transferase-like glycosyltransferase